jgi:hypothetical protein
MCRRQQQEARDVLVAAASQGVDLRRDGRELGKMLIDAVTPINQQLQELLGSSAYDQLLNSEEALPMRSIAHDLQLTLDAYYKTSLFFSFMDHWYA